MKEHPRLLNTEMVQAVLAGRKTQTRAPVAEWQYPYLVDIEDRDLIGEFGVVAQRDPRYGFCLFGDTEQECMNKLVHGFGPFGSAGDLLYIRESWYPWLDDNGPEGFTRLIRFADDFTMPVPDEHAAWFDTRSEKGWHKRPSIHMPKWAARIWLRVEGIRVERIQDISEQDAWSEGIDLPAYASASKLEYPSPRKKFADLWDSIYRSRDLGWKENPWVWVADFSVASTTGRDGVSGNIRKEKS